MSNNKEMWLSCNDMGVWNMEHEGDCDRDDTVIHIVVDAEGKPIIKTINPEENNEADSGND